MTQLSESDRAWWVRPDDYIEDEDPRAHEKLHAIITHLERNQDRRRDLLLFGAMYAGGLSTGGLRTQVDTRSMTNYGTLSLNVSRSVVDAVCSRVFAKGRPKLSYVTEGGDYEKQENAEKLEAGVEGAFYQANFDDKSVSLGRDGTVYGTGIVRVRANYDTRTVDVLRWRPWQYIVDDAEILMGDGEPRSIYTTSYDDRGVLCHRVKMGWYASGTPEELAEKARLVSKLTCDSDSDAEFGYQQVALRVRVEEAWHRPSGVGANDGRHVIGVFNCTLVDEPWDGGPSGRTEFANFRWCKPLEGFYGQGLVEIGAGIQAEINKLVRQIQNGHHLITGKYLVEMGSKVVLSHINNDLSSILRYTGVMPEYVAPAIIQPEVYQHLWNLVGRYYSLSGVNEQSASAQKPAGLDSGEAQRVYADQQTETLLEKGQRFEAAVRDCGQLVTDAAKALAKEGAYEVRAMQDDGFETIDWKTLDDPDGYELRVNPTSRLPGTPSGKINLAQDLMKVGEFDPGDLLEVVGMPDILQITKRKQSTRKLVEKIVGKMLREGTSYEPTPFLQPLPMTAQIATEMLNLAESKDVDDTRLQLVRDFVRKVQLLIKKSAPPPTPPVMGPPGMPPPGVAGAPAIGAAPIAPPVAA